MSPVTTAYLARRRRARSSCGGPSPTTRRESAPDEDVRRRHLLLNVPVDDARDQLPRHQRGQAPAEGLAAGRVLGHRGGRRSVRRRRADRAAARRLPAQDDAPAGRAPYLVRPAAHRRRRDHLRRLREPGRAARRAADPRLGRVDLPRARLRPERPPRADRLRRPISRRSVPSSSRRPGSPPTTSAGLVEEVAGCPLLMFIKEDEDLYPNLDYSARRRADQAGPGGDRDGRGPARRAGPGLRPARQRRAARDRRHGPCRGRGRGHRRHVQRDLRGGAVRMVREATKHLPRPPAIYGHNAGIGVKTRAVWREVIDLLARLDGIDFRQTALCGRLPVPAPLRRRNGWHPRRPSPALPGINPTMITRAGRPRPGQHHPQSGRTPKQRGIAENVLFLAGSAINSIKNAAGKSDPALGAEAMHAGPRRPSLRRDCAACRWRSISPPCGALADRDESWKACARSALRQRYPGRGRGMTKDDRLLRIGVLGCGPIAQFAHFDACRKARNAELYAPSATWPTTCASGWRPSISRR